MNKNPIKGSGAVHKPLHDFGTQIRENLLLTGKLERIRIHAVVGIIEDKFLQPFPPFTRTSSRATATAAAASVAFPAFADLQVGDFRRFALHADDNRRA